MNQHNGVLPWNIVLLRLCYSSSIEYVDRLNTYPDLEKPCLITRKILVLKDRYLGYLLYYFFCRIGKAFQVELHLLLLTRSARNLLIYMESSKKNGYYVCFVMESGGASGE